MFLLFFSILSFITAKMEISGCNIIVDGGGSITIRNCEVETSLKITGSELFDIDIQGTPNKCHLEKIHVYNYHLYTDNDLTCVFTMYYSIGIDYPNIEETTPCYPDCEHGTCTNHKCDCHQFWNGSSCEIHVCDPHCNPENGRCEIYDDITTPECRCYSRAYDPTTGCNTCNGGWYGDECEIPICTVGIGFVVVPIEGN